MNGTASSYDRTAAAVAVARQAQPRTSVGRHPARLAAGIAGTLPSGDAPAPGGHPFQIQIPCHLIDLQPLLGYGTTRALKNTGDRRPLAADGEVEAGGELATPISPSVVAFSPVRPALPRRFVRAGTVLPGRRCAIQIG